MQVMDRHLWKIYQNDILLKLICITCTDRTVEVNAIGRFVES
jgi:hypothetical protein